MQNVMGLLGVKRVHLLLHQIFDILWHLSPCGVDSLTIGRFLIRIVILACAGKEIENFFSAWRCWSGKVFQG